MICPQCNQEAPDANYICPHCHYILKPGLNPSNYLQDTQAKKLLSKKNTNAAVALAIVLVIIALVYFGIQRETEPTNPKTQDAPASTAGKTSTSPTDFAPVVNSANPGDKIDIQAYVQKGKITVFDFYSEYCPPCRAFAPYLKQLDQKREDLVVVKIDINRPSVTGIDWAAPVVSQYNIQSIPYFILFDASGNKIAEGANATQQVIRFMSDAGLDIE